jgi:trehalose/maltose hydrolase-like predicted phosphorylase
MGRLKYHILVDKLGGIKLPIKPIDMQGMVPKSQQISKVQRNNDYKQEHFVNSQTMEQNKEIERKQKQVNKASESYKLKINKESESNKKRKSKKDKSEQNKKKKSSSTIKEKQKRIGKYLDVKI